jgi:hypothetical protein
MDSDPSLESLKYPATMGEGKGLASSMLFLANRSLMYLPLERSDLQHVILSFDFNAQKIVKRPKSLSENVELRLETIC